jgi:hypothetical protein
MKHFATGGTALLAGLAIALTGCAPATSNDKPEAPVAASSSASTVALASPSPSKSTDRGAAAWVEYVRNRTTTLASKTDDSLIAGARKTCDSLTGGQLFAEAVYDVTAKRLAETQQSDQILALGTGIAQFCPEFSPSSTGDDTADFLASIRAAAPSIAHNTDAAILAQARMVCPSVKEGPAGGAKVIATSREAWGFTDGYNFALLATAQFCSGSLDNIVLNK